MRKIIYLFIFIIISASSSNLSFSQGDMSGNKLFLASLINENSQNVICVHKFMTKELMRKITLTNSGIIDEIKMSYSGKYLYVKQGSNYTIIDIMLNESVANIRNAKQVIFPKDADFFLVLKSNSIKKYDCISGTVSINFDYPSGKDAIELVMGPNDKFFAAKAVDRVFVYNVNDENKKKHLLGKDIKFRENGKMFTVLAEVGDKIRVSSYELPSLYQKRAFASNILLEEINPSGEIFTSRCSLSKDGRYVAIYTAKGKKVEIFVFGTYSGDKIWTINNFINTSNELFPQKWSSNYSLIGYGDDLMAGEYNMRTRKSKALGLRIDDFVSSPALSLENQKENRIISPDFHYVIIQDGNNMHIRDSRIPNKKTTYSKVEFICFSPDSKFLFVKKNNIVNAISTEQLSTAIKRNSPAKLYAFDSQIKAPKSESVIKKDAKPPKGYAYFNVDNTKQIVKLDTAKLHFVFRSMDYKADQVELKVNIVDANGNQFLGATNPNWKYIWCNLLLQTPNGSVRQVNDFKVEEKSKKVPTAYALVLDHSGSMGQQRANDLQFGAWDLVKNKQKDDAYMLIKYDNKVRVEAPLTKDKYLLQRKLNNTGITGYGGATALNDAAYLAAKKLAKSDYKKKIIILFTDGHENSSFYSKYNLLEFAIEHNIEIDVVGFGNAINKKYLKSLAYNTGGLYVHLYKTKDLKRVFRDIDFKRKNYYSVKFRTPVKGKHIAFLQLCQDQFKHDSIWIPFDNSVEQEQLDERDPIPPLISKDVKLTKFNELKIPINPVLKPVTNKKVNKDFKNITFPDILFETGSAKIIRSEKKGIEEIADFLLKYPSVYLEIHGHTDNQGTSEFNMQLSKDRAAAAKKLIIAEGVAPGRIITKGFGDTKPVASNDTEEGKAQNRRIEFHIFQQ